MAVHAPYRVPFGLVINPRSRDVGQNIQELVMGEVGTFPRFGPTRLPSPTSDTILFGQGAIILLKFLVQVQSLSALHSKSLLLLQFGVHFSFPSQRLLDAYRPRSFVCKDCRQLRNIAKVELKYGLRHHFRHSGRSARLSHGYSPSSCLRHYSDHGLLHCPRIPQVVA